MDSYMDGQVSFVGGRTCATCRDQPSYVLIPCHHRVCYNHVFAVGAERATMACGICHQIIYVVQPFASGFQEAAPSGFNTWSNAGHGPQTPSSRAGASPTSVYNSAFTHPMLQSGKSGFAFPSGQSGAPSSAGGVMLHDASISAMYGQPSPHDQIRSHFLEDPFVAAEGEKPKTQPVPSPSALAEMIKSGAFEDPDDPPIDAPSNRGHMGHNGIAPIALPLVQLWGSHMVAPVAIPPFLAEARSGQRPSFELAMDHQPFTLPGESIPVAQNGVVLVKNIPYGSTKAEIIAAIGRNSRIVAQPPGSPFYAIHIIMERSTGKTMDCYVELESSSEARGILYSYRSRCDRGRTPRVGERHVEVELSSQEALMEQIFPKARCVTWQGQEPHIYQPKEAYNSGFMGFITVEECAMIVKHAENPSRSPFVARALNRSYESMISMLYKYPWFKSELITLGERALLFRTACGLLKVLCRSVASRSSPGQLSQILLQELLCATLTVPFSHKQKNEIAELAAANGFGALVASIGFIPMLHYGNFWPFEALDKKPGVRDEVVEFYASLFHEATYPTSPAALSNRALVEMSINPFGALHILYPSSDTKNLSLRAAAAAEWDAMTAALGRVLPRSGNKSPGWNALPASTTGAKGFDAAPGAGRKAPPTAPRAMQNGFMAGQRQGLPPATVTAAPATATSGSKALLSNEEMSIATAAGGAAKVVQGMSFAAVARKGT